MPKMAGTPARAVLLWLNPSISFSTACTLKPSYSIVAALSLVQSSPAGNPMAWLLISGVK